MGILKRLIAGLCHSQAPPPEDAMTVQIPFAMTRLPRITLAVFTLLAAGLAAVLPGGAAPPATETAVVVVSTSVQGADGSGGVRVVVTLRNVSRQIVTAWEWSVVGHYADGSTHAHSASIDDVSALLGPDMSFAFRPGTTRTFEDALPLGPHGDKPINANATILAVVLDDQTALGDHLPIREIAASRRWNAALWGGNWMRLRRRARTLDPTTPLER